MSEETKHRLTKFEQKLVDQELYGKVPKFVLDDVLRVAQEVEDEYEKKISSKGSLTTFINNFMTGKEPTTEVLVELLIMNEYRRSKDFPLVIVDKDILDTCVEYYKNGDKLFAIKCLSEELRKDKYNHTLKFMHEYLESKAK